MQLLKTALEYLASSSRATAQRENYRAAGNRDTQLMASANLDLVRSIYAPQERGEFSSAEWAHPEIEFVIDGPTPGSWSGLAGLAEAWRGVLSGWEELRVGADEYRELDDERILGGPPSRSVPK